MSDGVAQLELLNALRDSDPAKFQHVSDVYNLSKTPRLLELAIASSTPVFTAVLNYYAEQGRDINEQPPDSGNTALHAAVLSNSLDAARLLLSQPTINDTLANNAGETPQDLSQSPEMTDLLNRAQAHFLRDTSVRLKTAFHQRDLAALENIFTNPRVRELVDLNGIDPDTGSTVLHDAAAAGDLSLVKFILDNGGNPLVRNSRKQSPVDVAKGDQVQQVLAAAAKSQTVNSSHHHLEGFLKKWTNFTLGYRNRWFVLDNGVLSYYKSPDDKIARDTLQLSQATIKVQSSVNKGFELRTPGHKLLLRATHPNEANRWVWALQNEISASKSKNSRASESSSRATINNASHSATVGTTGTAAAAAAAARTTSTSPNSANHQRSVSTARSNRSTRFIDDLDNGGMNDTEDEDDEDEPLVEPSNPAAIIASLDGLAALIKTPGSEHATSTALEAIEQIKHDLYAWRTFHFKTVKRYRTLLEQSDNQQRLWAQNCRALEIKLEKAEGQLYINSKDDEPEDDDDIFYDTVDQYSTHGTHQSLDDGTTLRSEPQPEDDDATQLSAEAPKEVSDDTYTLDSSSQPAGAGAAAGAGAVAASSGADAHKQVQENTTKPSSDETPADKSGLTPAQAKIQEAIDKTQSFAGYEDGVRDKLAIDADNRPKISLWGVLKSLIGKDMTKMTLPVSFNECTNLLQRSAEDMEYVDLLDHAAAATHDDGLRMAFVAAFAASSYSSTIGRVAKPFNPLLGETFEYCRPDKDFRMISEQVSHHPPIGALLAESPRWSFYGHSNVKSKFYGRSFDIVPVGLWYLELRPDQGSSVEEELYTFRKVTSSVVGIMVGNPVVDNYGTMEITNHTTGIVCTLEFKPRGWRGSSAYKVEGHVKDKDGKELYAIGGAWNDKIYAKKAGDDPKNKSLLWQVHERPSAPFSLTPFAITLNALPEKLKGWLPPTDTRFRPDQRDMEEARYDEAADAKQRVENKQRAARREREEKGETYSPQWFKLAKHKVTGEEYYVPQNNYWEHRHNHELADTGDIF